MAKRMLADVLWTAANEHLWCGEGDTPFWKSPYAGSCCAVAHAQAGEWENWSSAKRRTGVAFLRKLGCNTNDYHFEEIEFGHQRQGVRYMWLLLAACVAEDEGLAV